MRHPPELAPTEIELFREEVRDVKPLSQEQSEPFRRRVRPARQIREEPANLEAGFGELLSEHEVETEDYLSFQRPGTQHRLFADLRAGRIPVEIELDLHGLTTAHAQDLLAEFLRHCQRHHLRCVQIIHGKGRGSGERQPVLKQKVNLWLRQRQDVLAFCSALRRDGGTGALYVLLRPAKPKARTP